MRWPISAVLLLAACVTPAAQDRYSLDDLKALQSQGAWQELSEHLTDVAPTKRDAAWEAVVAACAVGQLADVPAEGDPLAHLVLADALERRFPSLKRSEEFTARRAEWGVKDLIACHNSTACRGPTDREWTARVFTFAQTDPKHVAVPAAEMIQRFLIPEVTVPFYALALDGQGGPLCGDAGLHKAVLGALKGNNYSVDTARALAGGPCFDALKAPLLAELAQAKDNAELLKTSCDFLTQKGALDAAQKARCAPYAAYREKDRTTSATFSLEPVR